MTITPPQDYTISNVCVWVNAIGLGEYAPAFEKNKVDGKLLVDLTKEEMEQDLGLTSLQAKKVLKELDFAKELAAGGGGADPEEMQALKTKVDELEKENKELKEKLEKYEAEEKAKKEQEEAKKQQQQQKPKNQHYVAKGATRGAARGAVMGAVGGAIAGDPGKGAAMGAAMGATGGAMGGLGRRRRMRRMMG